MQEQANEEGVALPTTTAKIMDTWTLQMGFPLINVTRDYSTGKASVSQVENLIQINNNFFNAKMFPFKESIFTT